MPISLKSYTICHKQKTGKDIQGFSISFDFTFMLLIYVWFNDICPSTIRFFF